MGSEDNMALGTFPVNTERNVACSTESGKNSVIVGFSKPALIKKKFLSL
jgi:hypothetical protein